MTFGYNDNPAYVVGAYGNIVQLDLATFATKTINNIKDSYFLDDTLTQNNQDILMSDPNDNEVVKYSLKVN